MSQLQEFRETIQRGEDVLTQLREINAWLDEYLPKLRECLEPAREAVERHKL